ncbi:AraC-like ligand-binding domain-containing protein [Hydrogenophaga sp. A37]
MNAHQTAPVCPPRSRMATGEVPENQRFEYWLDMICSTYVQLECDRPQERALFGEIEFSRIGGLDLTELRANVPRVRRTPLHVSRSGEDYCLVQLQQAGKGVVCQDGRIAVVNPGDFVLYDCTRPYELMFDDEEHHVMVLRLPRAHLEQHVTGLEELTATTVSGDGAAGHLLLSMVSTLRNQADRLHPASAQGVSDAITQMIAAGLRSLPQANSRRPSNLHAYHLARIKAYVKERLRDPVLSVASVAQAAGLSPDHLSRLFRGEPLPLSRLIWQWRLEACHRDLVDPRLASRSVSDIAFSWGFNEAAHFSRSFKELYGLTPREWRQQALAVQPLA